MVSAVRDGSRAWTPTVLGAGLIVSSMAGHMARELLPEQEHDLAFAPADELLGKSFLGQDAVPDSMKTYIVS